MLDPMSQALLNRRKAIQMPMEEPKIEANPVNSLEKEPSLATEDLTGFLPNTKLGNMARSKK